MYLNSINGCSVYSGVTQNCRVTFKSGMSKSTQACKSVFSNQLKHFNLGNMVKLLRENKTVPETSVPLVAYFNGLQTKAEYLKEYAEKKLNGTYMTDREIKNAEMLLKLDEMQLRSERIPDYQVLFNNGTLIDRRYEEIRETVKSLPGYKLNDYGKRDFLNNLARSNYHSNDVSYDLNFKVARKIEKK